MDLALHQHGVDYFAAVIHGYITFEMGLAGFAVQFYYGDMSPKGEGEVFRLEEVNCGQAGLHIRRQVLGDVSGQSDILNGDMFSLGMRLRQRSSRCFHIRHNRRWNSTCLAFGSMPRKFAFLKTYMLNLTLQHVGRNLVGFFAQFLQREVDRSAADGHTPATEGADAVLNDGSVAVDDSNVVYVDA